MAVFPFTRLHCPLISRRKQFAEYCVFVMAAQPMVPAKKLLAWRDFS
jgi:hypothetical protein